MRKKLVALFLVFFFAGAAPVAGEQVVDRIVAEVNGEMITLYELEQKAKPILERFQNKQDGGLSEAQKKEVLKRVLQNMIDNMLLQQEAERLEMEIEDSKVRDRIRDIKNQRDWDDERFEQMLAKEGLERGEFEEKLQEDMVRQRLVNAMVRRKVVVTEEEIQGYYDENQDEFSQEKKVELRLLVVPSREKAETLRQRIVEGELDFAQAAREFSQGPAAEQGGDLGWVQWDDLASKWKDVLRSTDQGSITKPFPLQGQTALLYLEQVQDGEAQPLSAVRDTIAEQLRGPKFEKQLDTYLQRLRDKAVIDIRL
ncbi:MAG: SurA N-terminal domain-containing protein [Thermodesulfobacteriota bacterium]